jgi:iron complex outermembrane receptor protein
MTITKIHRWYITTLIATSVLINPSTALAKDTDKSVEIKKGGFMEEVLVTARKREESLQETPLAVSAFSGQALEEAGINNFTDLQNHVPSLDISSAFKGGLITIRSVAPTGGGGPWAEQPTGIYVDDVFQAHSTSRLLDLVDIESIQVLRGPQGTLFGKNTSAGALVITSQKPSNESHGSIKLVAGSYGRQKTTLAYNTALIEDILFGKVVFSRIRQDGYYENIVDGEEFFGEHRDAYGLQLRWLANDKTIVDIMATRSREIDVPRASSCEVVDYGPEETKPIIGILVTPEHPNKNYSEQCADVASLPYDKVANTPYRHNDKGNAQGSFDFRSSYIAVNLQYAGDNFDFKSITAYGLNEQFDQNAFGSDLDGTPLNVAYILNRSTVYQDQLSQEFQWSGLAGNDRLNWTVGLFGMHQFSGDGEIETIGGVGGILGVRLSDATIDPTATAAAAAAGLNPDETIVVVNVRSANVPEVSSRTYATYGQLSWDATDRLELTAGLRYSHEWKEAGSLNRKRQLSPGEIDNGLNAVLYIPANPGSEEFYFSTTNPLVAGAKPTFQNLPGALGNPVPMRFTNDDQQSDVQFQQLTPMISAAYITGDGELFDFLNASMTYFTVSAGWKGGGLRPTTDDIIGFDPEELINYELGVKLDLFDNTFRINGNVFYMDYSDKQQLVAIPKAGLVQVDQVLTNVDKVILSGTEWEIFWRPDAHWELNAGFSYVDDDIKEFFDSRVEDGEIVIIDRSNERSFNTRSTSANLGIQFTTATDLGTFTARLDISYKSDLYWGLDARTWEKQQARELTTSPAHTLLGGRVTWVPDSQWRITLWGKNLSNEQFVANGLGTTETFANVITIKAAPRTIGMDISYDF